MKFVKIVINCCDFGAFPGFRRFLNDVEYMIGFKPNPSIFWSFCWVICSPILITVSNGIWGYWLVLFFHPVSFLCNNSQDVCILYMRHFKMLKLDRKMLIFFKVSTTFQYFFLAIKIDFSIQILLWKDARKIDVFRLWTWNSI